MRGIHHRAAWRDFRFFTVDFNFQHDRLPYSNGLIQKLLFCRDD